MGEGGVERYSGQLRDNHQADNLPPWLLRQQHHQPLVEQGPLFAKTNTVQTKSNVFLKKLHNAGPVRPKGGEPKHGTLSADLGELKCQGGAPHLP